MNGASNLQPSAYAAVLSASMRRMTSASGRSETNPATGRYLGGDAIEFYRRLKGMSFKESVQELAQQYGIEDIRF